MSLLLVATWLLYFALFYLIVTSVILLRNRFDLVSLQPKKESENSPKISVCIPARNEENNIQKLLHSVIKQTYSDFEILVLDDYSEDNTYDMAKTILNGTSRPSTIIKSKPKPEEWLGKPWACHQLGKTANGEILLFLDADTQLNPDSLTLIAGTFENYNLDMLTVWPQQKLGSFWENTVIPLIYYALITLLPVIYVYRDPKWMPSFFREKFRPVFAAACGQCIAFKKEVYHEIGGHSSVRNNIVEDVELARMIRKNGFRMRMFHGVGSVNCRMYQTEKEMFEGFRKNFFAGFSNSTLFFLMASLLHLIVFVLPFITMLVAILNFYRILFFLSTGCVSIILMHRLILSVWFRWDPVYAFSHPVGVLWFQKLAFKILIDQITGTKPKWKGRNV